ncbi:MAG TPA: integrase core domain-containing protein [Nitrospira sp.]|nr:integrase core domain-containing protein [Nitrospira sp.]
MRCSMSRPENCWANAVVESFFASLKIELIYLRRFMTRQEAQAAIFTLGDLGPEKFERHALLVENRVH